MSVAWYFSVNAVPTGPLAWDELRQSAAEGKFGPPVAPFDRVQAGEASPVSLQIEFAEIDRRISGCRFEVGHEIANQGVRCPGTPLEIRAPPRHLDHLELGTTPAIPHPV